MNSWKDRVGKIHVILPKALYVKGYLKNEGDGFEFQLKNELSPICFSVSDQAK